MKSLNEVRGIERAFMQSHGGPWNIKETDVDRNKISRALIRAFRREFGKAFLGKINRYDKERATEYHLKEYTRGMVFNFEYGFVVPCDDEKLKSLITVREEKEYMGTRDDYEMLSPIMNRIEELGGIHLLWV